MVEMVRMANAAGAADSNSQKSPRRKSPMEGALTTQRQCH
jgi:hypothetical protein